MCKKIVTILVMLCCIVGIAGAEEIIWVSDCITEEAPHDQDFIDLLEAQGYTVTRLVGPQSLDQAKVDQMNLVDLVIVGRHGNSGAYDDGDEVALWNSITTPLIQQNAYLARSSRWKWLNSTSIASSANNLLAIETADPVFQLVELDENNSVDIVSVDDIAFVSANDPGNGTLVARRDNDSWPRVWIVRWETGQEFYPGSGQLAGGPRMYFPSAQSGGSPGDGFMNLTAQGQLIFLNAVYDMSGATFNRPPMTVVGMDKVNWVGTSLQLTGTVVDDGLPEPANVTVSWVQLSGPGTATFSATDIADPTVSFDAVGTYELEMTGSDGDQSASDMMVVTVADPAENKLVSLWTLDSIISTPGAAVVDDAGNNDGTFVGLADDLVTPILVEEPNIVTPGWVGAQALDFYGDSWIEVAADVADPNAFNIQIGVTLSAWIKGEVDSLGHYSAIVGKGENAWRMSAASGTIDGSIHFKVAGTTARIDSQRTLLDGNWHHIVGTYDSVAEKACLYIDGVLDTEQEATGLMAISATPVWIGSNQSYPADRIWAGELDDVRVYNYGISAADVEVLAAMAPRVPSVNAGEDMDYKRNAEGLTITGIVTDDGLPVPATISWSVASKTEGVADPIFAPADAAETVITFSEAGTYILKLTADDTIASISDEVTVTVTDPTCQDVIDAGLLIAGDINSDCYINLEDFAIIAASWLNCNNPQDSSCQWAF